jgi:hypothetical protein
MSPTNVRAISFEASVTMLASVQQKRHSSMNEVACDVLPNKMTAPLPQDLTVGIEGSRFDTFRSTP